MKIQIEFGDEEDMSDYTTDTDILPRLGDTLRLPSADSTRLYRVVRVHWAFGLTDPDTKHVELQSIRVVVEAVDETA